MKARVYACQPDIVWEDPGANFKRILSLLKKAKPRPHSLIVLPELFAVGFSMNTAGVAEAAMGATVQFLRKLARQCQCAVVAGAPRKQGGRSFNEAVCLSSSGQILLRYTKIHLFNPGGEGRHYTPGSTVKVFKWEGLEVAPFVCYDLRFPEVFRTASANGAELMIVIANWPAKRDGHWQALLQARAIENQAFVLGVNRTGSDPSLEYWGNSMLFGPKGELIASAGRCEGVLTAQLDLCACRQWRKEFPVLADRRKRLGISC